MTACCPEVWLIYSKGKSHSIRDTISRHCKINGWKYFDRPTSPVTLPSGRPIGKMTPEDATNLYRRIHTTRIGVWQVGNADAPIRPNPSDSLKHYMSLSRFVQYKAYHCRIHPDRFSEQWPESTVAFQSWIEMTGCEGESDPRCLPFHVFGADLEKYDLGTSVGRQRFELDHRWQGHRRDDRKLLWSRPPASQMHSRPILQVAGRDLIRGFHWDVSSQRDFRVSTTSEVWKVRRHGHMNVSPNAHIRGSKNASRVYP